MPHHVDKAFNLTKKKIIIFYGYSIFRYSMKKDSVFSPLLVTCLCSIPSSKRGEEQGSKSPFSLLSEPISPSSLDVYLTFSPSSQLFPLFLPPPNFFWAISPSSLFCSSPLLEVICELRLCIIYSCRFFSEHSGFSLVSVFLIHQQPEVILTCCDVVFFSVSNYFAIF